MSAIHHGHDDGSYGTTCGAAYYDKADSREFVTCKRCLASLAKRDRAFQRKARATFARNCTKTWRRANRGRAMCGLGFEHWTAVKKGGSRIDDAVHAIAREEGRAL